MAGKASTLRTKMDSARVTKWRPSLLEGRIANHPYTFTVSEGPNRAERRHPRHA